MNIYEKHLYIEQVYTLEQVLYSRCVYIHICRNIPLYRAGVYPRAGVYHRAGVYVCIYEEISLYIEQVYTYRPLSPAAATRRAAPYIF